eukprot:COSAG02_NODE_1440_length_12590_cov_2.822352_1_plen_56_part_00
MHNTFQNTNVIMCAYLQEGFKPCNATHYKGWDKFNVDVNIARVPSHNGPLTFWAY